MHLQDVDPEWVAAIGFIAIHLGPGGFIDRQGGGGRSLVNKDDTEE